ncbi:hypothetical protein L914_02872 [Phytophthora nicotianae]|uniref:Uncharacterized protein n=1 Tax=Phytophthora nicotianae TaxID=4792 RepID=W2NYN2_PHYNI|nr:hypothetical protein L914_02872 [Phytophthora nicotianae]
MDENVYARLPAATLSQQGAEVAATPTANIMTTLASLIARSSVQACQEKLLSHCDETDETANMSGANKGIPRRRIHLTIYSLCVFARGQQILLDEFSRCCMLHNYR